MFSLIHELLYGCNEPKDALSMQPSVKRTEGRKRLRGSNVGSDDCTDTHSTATSDVSDSDKRPTKKPRVSLGDERESKLLSMVPDEVVNHVLSFCGSVQDRFALQSTCKTFQRITTDCDEMLANIKLGGDMTGKGGIVTEDDTPATASNKLTPFAKAGNLEAIYMLGMIKSYCHQDVDKGINLLKLSSKRGYVRATYTLGLMLRDIKPRDARRYMSEAAEQGYLPALQELLPAREMKAKYGEPTAAELCHFLDPVCLNRLLAKHYVVCPNLRDLNTSHCWNPLCGRWAFRAHHHHHHQHNHPRSGRRLFGLVGSADKEPSTPGAVPSTRVSRMKMCSRCCRAKYCSKLCQVYDWRSGRHKVECPFL